MEALWGPDKLFLGSLWPRSQSTLDLYDAQGLVASDQRDAHKSIEL